MEKESSIKFLDSGEFSRGQRVLLRLDLNVPCKNGVVENDFRITRIIPTLEFLSKKGCRTTIVSHLGADAGVTLAPVAEHLGKRFKVSFADSVSSAKCTAGELKDGEFLLVENIRRESGEEKNEESFAKRLAGLGEVFVNDAFSVCHRKHASVVGVPKFLPSYAGFLMQEEIKALTPALNPPEKSLFVLGGAKFETKLPLLLKFLDRYERAFVGGALANDIFQAMELEVGVSLVSPLACDLSTIIRRPNLRIPLDVVVERGGEKITTVPEGLKPSDRIVDAGIETVMLLEQFVSESSFILWNGPLGVYQEGLTTGTEQCAKAIARSGAQSVIGGGDTITAIERLGLMDKFGFVSTGGGAMLDFLANETLPGIEALKR